MLTITSDIAWMHMNAEQTDNGIWTCKKHDIWVTEVFIQRSIYEFPLDAGFGQSPLVRHIFCEKCHPEHKKIKEGEPIFNIELMEYSEEIKTASNMKGINYTHQLLPSG